MSSFFRAKRQVFQALPQILISLLLVYFAYHIVEGKRGITAWRALTAELSAVKAERAQVAAEKAELAHRVKRLTDSSLDPDLLEERARIMLNYGRAGDLVILRSTLEESRSKP